MSDPPYQILNPDATVAGETISEWTQDWFTWAWQAPVSSNPLLDTTGADANYNNNHAVYFIAGTQNGTADRTFNVPVGKPLLVPMINLVDIVDPKSTENKMMSQFQTSVSNLFAEIDGVPVAHPQSYLERTDFFSLGINQPGSLIGQLAADNGLDFTNKDLSPSKGAGYWLMITGLTPGPHTLHFGGQTSGGSLAPAFSVDITDHITVG